MRILMIGGTRFIGRALARQAEEQGHVAHYRKWLSSLSSREDGNHG